MIRMHSVRLTVYHHFDTHIVKEYVIVLKHRSREKIWSERLTRLQILLLFFSCFQKRISDVFYMLIYIEQKFQIS